MTFWSNLDGLAGSRRLAVVEGLGVLAGCRTLWTPEEPGTVDPALDGDSHERGFCRGPGRVGVAAVRVCV